MRPAFAALIEVSVRTATVALVKRQLQNNTPKAAKAVSNFQKWIKHSPANPVSKEQGIVLNLMDNVALKTQKPIYNAIYHAPLKFKVGGIGRKITDAIRRDATNMGHTSAGKKIWNMGRKDFLALGEKT